MPSGRCLDCQILMRLHWENNMLKFLKIILLGIIALGSVSIYANPPKDIKITFDPKTKLLTAVIIHDTLFPTYHYIKTVEIDINNQKAILHTLTEEETKLSETVIYKLPDVKAGDTVSVEASCSLFGRLKKAITIPKN